MNTQPSLPNRRIKSIDALRGFDMFWITGGKTLVSALAVVPGFKWLVPIEGQMHHVPWNGFHFLDLIFPLFMFLSGVVIPFSLLSKIEKGALKNEMIRKVFKRMVTLIILGLIYNGVLEKGFSEARYVGVLGQIGIAYFFATFIVIYNKSLRNRLIWLAGILFSIAIIQLFIPVPGIGAGVLTPKGCINGYIDRAILPGRLYFKIFDPEGTLCIVSATGVTLLGSIVGNVLREKKIADWVKVKYMVIIGFSLIVIALTFSPFYPIIKNCWTSSFVLLTGGISTLLLAIFYTIIDILNWHRWSFFFRVIGMNSIFIYLLVKFIDTKEIAQYLLGWSTLGLGDYYHLANVTGAITLVWLLLFFMYKKNIFLKV